MKKSDLVKVFGNASAVARFFGISRQAVSIWSENIPPLRVYQIRERRPEIDSEIQLHKAKRGRK